MDITTIDAVSFATRVGQAAASELYALLLADQYEQPFFDWFNTRRGWADDELAEAVTALGQYVCANQVEQGERLFRWGQMRAIVPAGDWTALDVAGRQAFETFVDTTRNTWLGIAVAQQALRDARKAAGVPGAPTTELKREDSIFEDLEGAGDLRPEAKATGPLLERMRRETEAAKRQAEEEAAKRQAEDEARRAQFNGADPAAFDHDQDGKPGGSRKREKPAPISAGETVAKRPVNRGGRGRKKAP